jgi:hypothetical protein
MGHFYSAGAGAGVAPVPTQTREGSLPQAIEQFDPIIKKLIEQRIALGGMVDRLVGPHPTPVESEAPNEQPAGRVATLNLAARLMVAELERIDGLLRQLDATL